MNNNIALKSTFGIMSDCATSSNASLIQRVSYSFSNMMNSFSALMGSFSTLMGSTTTLMSSTVDRLSHYYSSVLEEPVDRKRTLRLLHAQIAFLSMLLLAGSGPLAAALGVAWFAIATRRCRY